ncbi:MAG: DNA repair protein RecO C-terminal domain-containing protein, partial [Solirubrobacterales bacterium]
TIDGYARLRSSADALDSASKVCDFVLRLLDGRERNGPAYNLITNILGLLDADPRAARREVGLAFRAKMLLASGFSPELGLCVQCAATAGLAAFSPSAGGIVCGDCRAAGDFDFGRDAYAFMSGAIGSPLADAPAAGPEALRQTDRAISEIVAHHAHVHVRQLV